MTAQNKPEMSEFIEFMLLNETQRKYGYELLTDNSDERFLPELIARGLLDSNNNPAPVEIKKDMFTVPYWEALPYLKTIAKKAGEKKDSALAESILNLLRDITEQTAGTPAAQNFYTWNAFAEILAVLPVEILKTEDVQMLDIWILSRFGSDLIERTIGEKLLPKFLDDPNPSSKNFALQIFHSYLRFKAGSKDGESDFWFGHMLERNAEKIGSRLDIKAADVMIPMLKKVFSDPFDFANSWMIRPAVEDHEQNKHRTQPAGQFVDATRVILQTALQVPSKDKIDYVRAMLADESQIIRRIAVYIFNLRYDLFKDFTKDVLPLINDTGHLHEVYNFLKAHFAEFSESEQTAVFDIIHNLPISEGENGEEYKALRQRRWLSAIQGKGNTKADELFAKLMDDKKLGLPTEHEDFLSYMTTRWGGAPSPFPPEKLLAALEQGKLIITLNEFASKPGWNEPDVDAVVNTLQDAITQDVATFFIIWPDFLKAKRPYQYGFIAGLRRNWDSEQKDRTLWANNAEKLLKFFEDLLTDEFWTEPVEDTGNRMTPTKNWIPGKVLDFIRDFLDKDDSAFPTHLVPRVGALTIRIFQHLNYEAKPNDFMSQAINSDKGRAIETLVSYALRVARMAREEGGQPELENEHGWVQLKPLLDSELPNCQDKNFEISTLIGSYFSNLRYLDHAWLEANLPVIFNPEFPLNYEAAVAGLPYAGNSGPLYKLLAGHGIIEWALDSKNDDEEISENLLSRIGLAYLWDLEPLDGAIFKKIFSKPNYLKKLCWLFWTWHSEEITPVQKNKVIAFWARLDAEVQKNEKTEKIYSNSLLLAAYIVKLDKTSMSLIEGALPYVTQHFNLDDLLEELCRLVEVSASEVAELMPELMKVYKSFSDYNNRLKDLMGKLAIAGQVKVIRQLCNELFLQKEFREFCLAYV